MVLDEKKREERMEEMVREKQRKRRKRGGEGRGEGRLGSSDSDGLAVGGPRFCEASCASVSSLSICTWFPVCPYKKQLPRASQMSLCCKGT